MSQPNHLLVSGFIAAVFQFSLQFGQNSIKHIVFDKSQIGVESRKIGEEELIFVLFASRKIKLKKLRVLVKKIANIFEQNYKAIFLKAHKLKSAHNFTGFSEKLLAASLVSSLEKGEVPLVNTCQCAEVSDLQGHIFCTIQQKNISINEELGYMPASNCPFYESQK